MTAAQHIPAGRDPLSEQVAVIETARLLLRPVRLSDEKALTAYWTSERSRPNDGPLDRKQVQGLLFSAAFRWFYRGLGMWIGTDRNTGNRLVGCAISGVEDQPQRADMGWDVLTGSAEGFGYATEAAGALLRHGRKLGFTDIRASMNADNWRSRRLAEKLGGVFLQGYDRKGIPAVTYRFAEAA